MFIDRRIALALEKQRLLDRIAVARTEVAADFRAFDKPLAAADKVVQGVEYLKAHPWASVLGGVVGVFMARRRAVRWALRGWAWWRTGKQILRWVKSEGFLRV